MSYIPDTDDYLYNTSSFDPTYTSQSSDIEDIVPVLNELFLQTEVALSDLRDSLHRHSLSTACKNMDEIYQNISRNRDTYNELIKQITVVI